MGLPCVPTITNFSTEPLRVDRARVDYLRENDLAQGIEILTDFDGERIRAPRFWESNAEYRESMIRALSHRAAAAGIA